MENTVPLVAPESKVILLVFTSSIPVDLIETVLLVIIIFDVSNVLVPDFLEPKIIPLD